MLSREMVVWLLENVREMLHRFVMYSVLGPQRNSGCAEERSVLVVRPNQWGCSLHLRPF